MAVYDNAIDVRNMALSLAIQSLSDGTASYRIQERASEFEKFLTEGYVAPPPAPEPKVVSRVAMYFAESDVPQSRASDLILFEDGSMLIQGDWTFQKFIEEMGSTHQHSQWKGLVLTREPNPRVKVLYPGDEGYDPEA